MQSTTNLAMTRYDWHTNTSSTLEDCGMAGMTSGMFRQAYEKKAAAQGACIPFALAARVNCGREGQSQLGSLRPHAGAQIDHRLMKKYSPIDFKY